MRNDLSSFCPASVESGLQRLPGLKLTHTVRLVSSLNPSVVSTAAAALETRRANVEQWAVTRCAGLLEQRIVLVDMTERQAIEVREQLAALDGVARASVEHQFVREAAA
ncbi:MULTISPECIES: hypothetical protein [unclassified Paraburkholderia]|uniref:hypothetical protein n=1 Tax=unclassified Paraburkholderia TaxID=2615204 RepID=UPI00198104E2|nr:MULTISPECIES: hypothetical protein [unclassified Paraburkholderia]MBN3853748.1 hypothetical protein [Paraburkholderia sp. Ac-20340]